MVQARGRRSADRENDGTLNVVRVVVFALLLLVPIAAMAEPTPAPMSTVQPVPGEEMPGMPGMQHPAPFPHPVRLFAPMTRDGSGTSWMPDASEMYGTMRERDGVVSMDHYALFPRYVTTGSKRGDRALSAPGWFMASQSTVLDTHSEIRTRAMLSLDELTIHGRGFPELLQTGETNRGLHLHDHQHPHNVLGEISVGYDRQLGRQRTFSLYVADPGEPALGPPAFMHRRIGWDMPDPPISHHWSDSTHITFGVLTAGLGSSALKLEASTFTGREPNEIRTNFNPVHLDSYSARLSWNPSRFLAAQASFAAIKEPESTHPGNNRHNTSLSVLFERPTQNGDVYVAAIAGRNADTQYPTENAYLLEAVRRVGSQTFYARAERVQKDEDDLGLGRALTIVPGTGFDGRVPQHLQPGFARADAIVDLVGAYTLGFVHDLRRSSGSMQTGIGGQLTLDAIPPRLRGVYGKSIEYGGQLFLRLRPPLHRH